MPKYARPREEPPTHGKEVKKYPMLSELYEAGKLPELEGRVASCGYGMHGFVESNSNLPFFQHFPDREYDEYYCGCWGWE